MRLAISGSRTKPSQTPAESMPPGSAPRCKGSAFGLREDEAGPGPPWREASALIRVDSIIRIRSAENKEGFFSVGGGVGEVVMQ